MPSTTSSRRETRITKSWKSKKIWNLRDLTRRAKTIRSWAIRKGLSPQITTNLPPRWGSCSSLSLQSLLLSKFLVWSLNIIIRLQFRKERQCSPLATLQRKTIGPIQYFWTLRAQRPARSSSIRSQRPKRNGSRLQWRKSTRSLNEA